MKQPDKKVLLVVGPTASGKTELGIQIAMQVGGEIVSADSRQVFRLMNIGTAKPTAEERAAVAHHCMDIRDPSDLFTAGEYGNLAREIISDLHRRGRMPVVVGGSGLYIKALVDGVFQGHYRDPAIRRHLKQRMTEDGAENLWRELADKDPDAAVKIHINDVKRVIRALEVCLISGRTISEIQKEQTVPASFTPFFWGLNWPRDLLYRRIEERIDRMVADGLVDEVNRLKEMGYDLRCNSLDSLGYKEVFAYLEGQLSLDETVDLIKRNTRRFAKRQMTWFRKDKRIRWIEMTPSTDWEPIVETILDTF